MNCLRLSGSESVCTYFQAQENIACGLRVALAAIAACGLVLSICSIVSYLPPVVGYVGGTASVASLITLACSCIRRRRESPVIPAENEVKSLTVEENIVQNPQNIELINDDSGV